MTRFWERMCIKLVSGDPEWQAQDIISYETQQLHEDIEATKNKDEKILRRHKSE